MVFPRIGRQHWWQMEHASLVLLLFLLDIYNLPHPLNCVIQVVSTCKRCLYALLIFGSVSRIPICFVRKCKALATMEILAVRVNESLEQMPSRLEEVMLKIPELRLKLQQKLQQLKILKMLSLMIGQAASEFRADTTCLIQVTGNFKLTPQPYKI